MNVERIEEGSDRRFYRVSAEGIHFIIVKDGKPYRLSRYVQLAFKLPGTPKIYAYFEDTAVVEDLGRLSLYDYYLKTHELDYHAKAIEFLKILQSTDLDLPRFGEEHLLYEVEMFERFNPELSYLSPMLRKNAKIVSKQAYVVMHRDFQSRNIFIKQGRIRIVDFQDAHVGPIYYDLASLLYDPYLDLSDEEVEELLNYYGKVDEEMFLRTAIQRLAQALSAYVRLSAQKTFFSRFIDPTRKRLLELLDRI